MNELSVCKMSSPTWSLLLINLPPSPRSTRGYEQVVLLYGVAILRQKQIVGSSRLAVITNREKQSYPIRADGLKLKRAVVSSFTLKWMYMYMYWYLYYR